MTKEILRILVIVAAFATAGQSAAFELLAPGTVEGNHVEYHVWLPGQQADGRAYSDVFLAATEVWAKNKFDVVWGQVDLGWGNGINEVLFDRSIGYSGLANISLTTAPQWNGQTGSWAETPTIGEMYILLNDEYFVEPGANLHNTMVHEIGHNLGLNHGAVEHTVMKQYRERVDYDLSPSLDDECGIAHLQGRQADCEAWRGQGIATNDEVTWSHFYGFVTPDFGMTAAEVFSPYQELQIYGTVAIDPGHEGRAGAIHVIAVAPGGALYGRNEMEHWIPVTDTAALPAVERIPELGWSYDFRIAGASIAEQQRQWPIVPWSDQWGPEDERRQAAGEPYRKEPLFTGELLGLAGQQVELWLAYSLEDMPGVSFHSKEPIVVQWLTESDLQ